MHYANPEEWLADCYAWNVWHDGEVYSIDNMDDKQLMESILEDLLQLTFYETSNSVSVHFTYATLVRFLPKTAQRNRVKEMLESETVQKYVTTDQNGMLRIKNDRHLQQEMMDLIGVWMEGFDVPDSPGIIRVNNEVLKEKVEQHGGIDNLAKALSMEVEATHEGTKAIN